MKNLIPALFSLTIVAVGCGGSDDKSGDGWTGSGGWHAG
jgi:hypothetical protein